MSEAVRNLVMLVWAFSAVHTGAQAQLTNLSIMEEAPDNSPVMVWGSANRGNGQRDDVLLEQNSEDNPLGNPIETTEKPVVNNNLPAAPDAPFADLAGLPPRPEVKKIQETLPQNPQLSPQESPQNVNKQIQDTLYESGGRIYDVQSYPASDIKYLEEPNLDRSITTYPAN